MAGLPAVRFMFLGVLLSSALALTLLCLGIAFPDWSTIQFAKNTDKNKVLDRVKKAGLFQASIQGECTTDECRDAWLIDEAQPEEDCKTYMQRLTGKSDHKECWYGKRGYCNCPYPEGDYAIKEAEKLGKGACGGAEDDYTAENAKEYAEEGQQKLAVAIGTLIASTVLIFIAIVLSIAGAVTAKWILGVVGSVLLCLAFALAVTGLVFGVQAMESQHLAPYCGSQTGWRRLNEARTEDAQEVYDGFGMSAIMVLVGSFCLFVACALGCIVSGLAKKIHKVADIGDFKI